MSSLNGFQDWLFFNFKTHGIKECINNVKVGLTYYKNIIFMSNEIDFVSYRKIKSFKEEGRFKT